MFFPARGFGNGDGRRGRMLVFDLEHVWVFIVGGPCAIPFHHSPISQISQGDGVPCVEPCSRTVDRERAFENRTGREGEHIGRDKETR